MSVCGCVMSNFKTTSASRALLSNPPAPPDAHTNGSPRVTSFFLYFFVDLASLPSTPSRARSHPRVWVFFAARVAMGATLTFSAGVV